MRWLLLGYGDLANKRLAAALQNAAGSELAAIWGRNEKRARDFAADHDIPEWYSGQDGMASAMASKKIDGVYVCTPVHTHYDYAQKALEHGKHVLCEKPLFADIRRCDELSELLQGSPLKFGVAYYRRCYPKMKRIHEIISSGEVGQGVSVSLNHHSWFSPDAGDPKRWRVEPKLSGGGPTADVGSHRFDLLAYWFGAIEVEGAMWEHLVQDYPAEDTSAFLLRFPDWNGASGTASFSWASKGWIDRLTIVGSEMIVVADPLDGPDLDFHWGREHKRETFEVPANPHLPLVEDFLRAVEKDGTPICLIGEARKTDAILSR